jgi:hypothetical protein
MGMVMDYVRSVMQKDNVTGMELLRLNEKHIQEEIFQMQKKVTADKKSNQEQKG